MSQWWGGKSGAGGNWNTGGGGGNWGNKGGAGKASAAPKPAEKVAPSSQWANNKQAIKPAVQAAAAVAQKPVVASSAASGPKPVFTVSSSSKKDEIGVQTLLGDYKEVGSNHGRKYYQKTQEIPGHKDVKVFLYYWDMRDGADFSGWWFGDELGGSQVWARCSSHGNVPPPVGWKIPWDAPKAEPGLLSVNPWKAPAGSATSAGAAAGGKAAGKGAGGAAAATGKGGTVAASGQGKGGAVAPSGAATAASIAARVKTATTQVEAIEKSSKLVTDRAKVLTKDTNADVLKKTKETLTSEQTKLMEAQKKLTENISEARKGGPTAVTSVTELSKLSPRLRTVSTNIATELNKIKGFANAAEIKKQQSANQEVQKKQEEKQSKELEETLPVVQEAVSAAEDAVESVGIMAAPIINDPPEDAGASLVKIMNEIETAATAAQTGLTDCRQQINTKLQTARTFAPETRKVALAEFTTLQTKLGEAQKKLNPFKNFKKEFQARVEAKKALTDINEKLGNAELEVEKAAMMTTDADQSQMSEEDVKSAEGLVQPARTILTSVSSLVESKFRTAQGPMREELTAMKARLTESQKKLGEVSGVLRRQKEGITLQSVYTQAHEKVDKVEDAFDKCSEAELCFLKGIEVLPQEESDTAIKESEAAAAQTTQLMGQAQGFLRTKMLEVKRYSAETSKKATEELNDLQKKLDAVQKKLTSFKTETAERKVTALMAEAFDSVGAAESKLNALKETAKMFESDDLEKTSVADIKAAGEKTAVAEKECIHAVTEARKVVANKQRSAKDKDTAQGLTKLTNRINIVQSELTKTRKNAAMGERLVKGKETIVEAESKLAEVEKEVEKVVKMSKPEDEGLGVEVISDDTVLDMDTICNVTSKSLRVVAALVQSNLTTAPPAIKATLTKLSERAKKAEGSIAEVKAITKEQRERVLSASYAKEGLAKTLEVEAALDKIAVAELPYLKGIEVLALEESRAAMAAADEASKVLGASIAAARTVIASKNLEIKRFDPKNTKTSLEECTKLTERVNSAAQKLGVFKKDTESRRKKAQMQEATVMISNIVASVEKVSEAMKPMMEKDPDTLSPEEASAMIKGLEELEASANKQVIECRTFLAARSRDAAGDKEKLSQVQELQTQLSTAQGELAKAKKLSGSHNDKLRCKALIQEAADKLKAAEAEFDKATTACAPVLEEKFERFLVRNSIATMCAALTARMEEKTLSEEAMLKEMGKPLSQDKFVAFVGKMPEAFNREECSFSEERRVAMFKSIDADGDGSVGLPEFQAMFVRQFTCVHSISITDVFDIGVSKTICKLEVGESVEGHGEPKKAEAAGSLPRMKCKITSGEHAGEFGWVTMQGNSGTKYVESVSPCKTFCAQLDKELSGFTGTLNKVGGFFGSKFRELATISKDSALQPAREELTKVRSKVQQVQSKMESLRNQVQKAKIGYPALELKEKNAHKEAKEQKEADAITIVARPAVEKVEADLKRLEEAAKPLTERQGADNLQEFATPVSVQDEVKALLVTLKAAVDAAKTVVKEQQEHVNKAVKGPMLDAKKEFIRWVQKVAQAGLTGNKVAGQVKSCCHQIASSKFQLAASAMQEEVQASKTTLEDLFKKLAGGKDRIPEEAFVTRVQGLKGLEMPKEHAILLTRKLESGGVGRRSFMRFLQKYFKVVKEIAITPGFEIVGSKDKPVRKAEMDEVFEILEGPKTDAGSGLERVRVRALFDGVEGWVSVKGNQGKVFLAEVEKPFYHCLKDIASEQAFGSGSAAQGNIKADEVLELVEGPRKETLASVTRLKGKAVQDGKIGWFTVKNRNGTVFAERGGKCYTCTATVAITDVFDIKSCKVLKKLAVDDVFTISEGPTIEESSGISRVKGKTSNDDVEGWVTIKGNAGSVYAKLNEKLYVVTQDVTMQSKFLSDSESMRTLTAGEAIEVLEGPREERFVPAVRAKVRSSAAAGEGWITVKLGDNVKTWTPFYKFVKVSSLYTSKGSTESVVREVALGEVAELQEGPIDVDGNMWMRAQMKKDGAIGWTQMKGEAGVRLLVQGQ